MPTPDHKPLVAPQKSFDYFRLDNARLPAHQQLVLEDPAERFCTDRFKLMTARQQTDLLAEIAMMRQERETSGVPTPFELSAMRSRPGAEPGRPITKTEAAEYYLDYPSKGRDMWLKRGLNDDQVRELVLNRLFDDLRRQLPAIAFTLHHLYRGGFHGLLTARGAIDSHRILLETISELFGFAPHTDLTYFVNDCSKSKRLGAYGSDVKKAIVLTLVSR